MHKITLSWNDAVREFLIKKLLQYLARIYNPCENEENRRDAFYKVGVVQMLLNNGSVSHADAEAAISSLVRGNMDDKAFQKAWDVIEDYNQTGGKNILQRSDQAIRV